jgi:hypothetical protein
VLCARLGTEAVNTKLPHRPSLVKSIWEFALARHEFGIWEFALARALARTNWEFALALALGRVIWEFGRTLAPTQGQNNAGSFLRVS